MMNVRRISASLKRLGRTPIARQSIGIVALLFLGTLTLTAHGAAFVALLASSAATVTEATTTIFLTPRGETTLEIGETSDIDVNLTTKVPINALGATITFPTDVVEVVGISKKDSFIELWTEETSIKEDAGTVHFSGGTTKEGGLVGSATALTITVRAKKAAPAELAFINVQVYPHDGTGKEITSTTRSLAYDIVEPPPSASTATTPSSTPQAYAPSADLNGSGSVTIIDLSILTFRVLGPYDPRYDLNVDGTLGLGDISVLLSHL